MPNAATTPAATETLTRDWTVATATITFKDRGGDRQFVSVVYSDGREPVAGLAYHSDRDGAPSPDAWLGDELVTAPDAVIAAIATRGNADGSPMIVEIASTYEAADYGAGWHVTDTANLAAWWPNETALAEIEASDDPEQTALRLCHERPTSGEWHT